MTLTNSYSQYISYLDNDEKDYVHIMDAMDIRMMSVIPTSSK